MEFFLRQHKAPKPNKRAATINALTQFKDRKTELLPRFIDSVADTNEVVRGAALRASATLDAGNDRAYAGLLKEVVSAEGPEKKEILRLLKTFEPESFNRIQINRK